MDRSDSPTRRCSDRSARFLEQHRLALGRDGEPRAIEDEALVRARAVSETGPISRGTSWAVFTAFGQAPRWRCHGIDRWSLRGSPV